MRDSLQSKIVNYKNLNSELRLEKKALNKKVHDATIQQSRTQALAFLLFQQQEEERREISRELHDEVIQILTGVNYQLSALSKEAATHTGHLQRGLHNTQTLITTSIENVHRFAKELRPIVLDELGLIPAIRTFCRDYSKQIGVNIRVNASGSITSLSEVSKASLFRVAQEALTNAGKHAKASRITLSVKRVKENLQLKITDNGVAFNVKKLDSRKIKNRLGVLGMQERIRLVNGNFRIDSKMGRGTVIIATVPLKFELPHIREPSRIKLLKEKK